MTLTLQLRGEVSLLRQQTNQLQTLRIQNEQLRTNRPPGNAFPNNSSAAQAPLAVYPRATWAFAGYATPEAAFQSLNWAAGNGDLDTFLTALTPEEQQRMAKNFENKSATEVADEIKNSINKNTEFRILSKNVISDREVVLEILGNAAGPGETRSPDKLVFKNISGQWKLFEELH